MKFISWNVNGLRACLKKGFLDFYRQEAPDFCCLQETKMEQGQADVELNEGVLEFWNSAEKKGYSGTAVFTPHQPVAVAYGMDKDRHDHEGRLITLEYEGFYLVCCYTPNSQDGLKRLDYRMEWEGRPAGLPHVPGPAQAGGLLWGPERGPPGDRPENPKTNRNNAGFTDQEREKMTCLLSSGFTDSFRYLYPDTEGIYSWWSYRFNARKNNAGWRIDYFIVSDRLRDKIKRAEILTTVEGSDHCPVLLELDI